MRTLKITLSIVLLSTAIYSQNFWMQTNGPMGGNSYNITFAPNNDIYSVGGYDHIYRSTNDGTSWSQTNFINSGAYRYRCYSLAVSQNGRLFAGGGDNIYPGHHEPKEGVFKSTDSGLNWIKIIDAGYSKIVDFSALSNGYIFAARDADEEHQSPGGIYTSSNNGDTWNLFVIPPFMIADEGIKCIAADNNGNVYAGTTEFGYGYYYSSNFGASWSNRRDFYFTDIVVNQTSGTAFAVKPNEGIFRSTNNGLNWIKLTAENFNAVNSIWINSNGTLFTKTNSGILSSDNNGDTWFTIPAPYGINFKTLASKPNSSLYIGTEGDFIYKTSNNGLNWTQLSDGTINSDISSIAVNKEGLIFAAKNGGKIYFSNDNGYKWNIIITSIDSSSSLAIDSLNYIYAVKKENIFRSADNGNTWTTAISGLPPGMMMKFIYYGADGNVYAIPNANNGLFRSTNHGNSWNNLGFSFPINTIAVSRQGTIYAHVTGTGLFRTSNNGTNWFLLPQQLNSVSSICTNTAGNVFICTSNSGVLRSLDNGLTWTPVNTGINIFPHQIISNPQNVLFAVSTAPNEQSYFYRSLNSGNQWESMNAGWVYNQYSSYMISSPSGYLYTKAYKNFFNQSGIGIWRTFNSTNTFTVSGTVRYRGIGTPVSIGYVKAVKYYNGVIYTVDSGRIQYNGYYELPRIPADSCDLMAVQDDEETDNLFVPTYYPSTIYWQESVTIFPHSNLTNIDINVFRIENDTPGQGNIAGGVYLTLSDVMGGLKDAVIYAKRDNKFKGYSISKNGGHYSVNFQQPGNYEIICDLLGVGNQSRIIDLGTVNLDTINFYFPYGLIGVQNNNNEVPVSYILNQNYPNPFNPATTISFGLPERSKVSLTIYDIAGREIETLINNVYNAGTYKISWNASKYSSGVYFYRMNFENEKGKFSETKKLVLIK